MHSSFNNSIWAPISAIACGAGLGFAILGVTHSVIARHVEQIDRLTTEQCLSRAWPAMNDATMEAWCKANNYTVGLKR